MLFIATVFGVDMEVDGEWDAGEPQTRIDPGWPPEFIIESVTHKGEELEFDDFPKKEIDNILECAEKASEDESDEYYSERANCE